MKCLLVCEWEGGSQAIYNENWEITSWVGDDLSYYSLSELGCTSLDLREANWEHSIYWISYYNWDFGAQEYDWEWPDHMKEEYLR